MDSKASTVQSLQTPSQNPKTPIRSPPKGRDLLDHLEAYLAKRDGVDKFLKISRYATKIILASEVLPETLSLTGRLKSFESSVGLSRKAFRLGKFVQDINALKHSHFGSKQELVLSIDHRRLWRRGLVLFRRTIYLAFQIGSDRWQTLAQFAKDQCLG
jgi:hypothetical protein